MVLCDKKICYSYYFYDTVVPRKEARTDRLNRTCVGRKLVIHREPRQCLGGKSTKASDARVLLPLFYGGIFLSGGVDVSGLEPLNKKESREYSHHRYKT